MRYFSCKVVDEPYRKLLITDEENCSGSSRETGDFSPLDYSNQQFREIYGGLYCDVREMPRELGDRTRDMIELVIGSKLSNSQESKNNVAPEESSNH